MFWSVGSSAGHAELNIITTLHLQRLSADHVWILSEITSPLVKVLGQNKRKLYAGTCRQCTPKIEKGYERTCVLGLWSIVSTNGIWCVLLLLFRNSEGWIFSPLFSEMKLCVATCAQAWDELREATQGES